MFIKKGVEQRRQKKKNHHLHKLIYKKLSSFEEKNKIND